MGGAQPDRAGDHSDDGRTLVQDADGRLIGWYIQRHSRYDVLDDRGRHLGQAINLDEVETVFRAHGLAPADLDRSPQVPRSAAEPPRSRAATASITQVTQAVAAVIAAQRRLADASSTPGMGVQLGTAEHAMFVQWRLRRDDLAALGQLEARAPIREHEQELLELLGFAPHPTPSLLERVWHHPPTAPLSLDLLPTLVRTIFLHAGARRDDRIVLYPRSFLRHRDWLAPDGPGIGR